MPDATHIDAHDGGPDAPDGLDDVVVGTIIGARYRVTKKLGQGGMGSVYVAHQESLGREVALKIVRADLAQDRRHVERFRREARTLSQLVHPHIVALYDFGETAPGPGGAVWFAMELLRGASLRERLREQGRIKPDESVRIVREVCSALGAAHAQGVLHRDLKPDNVMLVEAFGRGDFVKLVDFGIAKANDGQRAEASLTQSGTVVGTPGYVPREVAVEGIHDDKRSDLYALGVTWFEMLTGRAPFVAQTALGLMMKHANDPPPRVVDVEPDVPPELAALVDSLLAKDPARRPASAEAILHRLDQIAPHASSPGTPAGRARATDSFATLRPAETLHTAPFLDADVSAHAETLDAPRRDGLAAQELRVREPRGRRLLLAAAASVLGIALATALALAFRGDTAGRARARPAAAAPADAGVRAAQDAGAALATLEAAEETPRAPEPPKPTAPPAPPSEKPKLLVDDKPKLLD